MDKGGDHMKMNFEYFQTQKWILQLDRKKQMKKWGHLSSSHIPFLSYGP